MPTYLCHGFRWHRPAIRSFVIINNLDDVAPDWIIGRTSASVILDQFRHSYDFLSSRSLAATAPTEEGDLSPPPSRVPASDDEVLMHDWSPVMLLEEYDLDETKSASRPFAYVADHVVRVDLGVNVAREMTNYQTMADQGGNVWFEKLRDKLQAAEDIQWYVVVCADCERAVPEEELDDCDEEEEEERHLKADPGEEELPLPPTKDYPLLIRKEQQEAAPETKWTRTTWVSD